jgi:hypothetical protein
MRPSCLVGWQEINVHRRLRHWRQDIAERRVTAMPIFLIVLLLALGTAGIRGWGADSRDITYRL